MLRSVYLKNYTLVDELSVDLGAGLTIVTGETGAGKSVIVGALDLVIGGRASADLVRAGTEKAVVEAEFDIGASKSISAYLSYNEIEHNGSLLIRREINVQGTSRAFINDSPVTIQLLKALGAILVDLHGQHDHQSLLYPDKHRSFLDAYAGITRELDEYGSYFSEYMGLRNEIKKLEERRADWNKERDFLEFQFKEIAAVSPEAGEDERIASELAIREHSEELTAATGELHELLYNGEDAVYVKLAQAKSVLERIAKLDPKFEEALEEVRSSMLSTRELAGMMSQYGQHIEFDPERLRELRERHVLLTRLMKKYGPTLQDVVTTHASLKEKLDPDNDIDEQIADRSEQLSAVRIRMSVLAEKLHRSRAAAAKKFEKAIRSVLAELGMEHAQFEVRIENEEDPGDTEAKVYVEIAQKHYNSYSWGIDKIEFYISTNKGEQPKPLARVASGGEISRIMLALKTVLTQSDEIPTLIFDEIDTGISGRIAQKVGKAMKILGKEHQVISITHLGQIAAFADRHYLVEKKTIKNTTIASIRLLAEDEHHAEIARLIAGETVSKESLDAARALKKEADELIS